MDESLENQEPLTLAQSAVRYACAIFLILFFGAVAVAVVDRRPDRLLESVINVVLGLVGLVLLRWRRRWPLPIALAAALLTLGSSTAIGPAFVAYVSLCTHRRWSQIAAVAAVIWTCAAITPLGRSPVSSLPEITQPAVVSMTVLTVSLAGLTVLGLYLRSRRDLVVAHELQRLAEEREQLERFEQIRMNERARIAREMHDVLAHRMSLLALHAGALAYRDNLSPDEVRQAARVIQENAHQSLTELRAVLGSLREGSSKGPPQPSVASVGELFDEVRGAGQDVQVSDTLRDREQLPAQLGRHTYRIVQESLTNARKHAPASAVDVELSGGPGDGVHIRVSNALPVHGQPALTGKLGLIGLAERTQMVGGSLRHTRDGGRFVLDAYLPWEAHR